MPTNLILFSISAFIVAFSTSFTMTPQTARLAGRMGILDRPDEGSIGYKKHLAPTPYLGGVAIFSGMILGAGFFLALPAARSLSLVKPVGIAILLAALLGIVGLLDDIRPLPRWVRIAAQLAAASGAWAVGFRVQATGLDALDLVITLFWIVGIANAFNLLDNMDGLSAGIAGVSAASFALLGLIGKQPVLMIVASALAGASIGFLAHNRHPARIFMGDAGSLFLGFLLALLGIRLRFSNLVEVTFLVPLVVLGVPIFDTTLVVLSRIQAGRKPFSGGRDHVSHRLIKLGLPIPAAVGLLYWSGICLGWLGITISRASVQVGWMLLSFVIALGLFFGWLLLRVSVYDDPR